MILSKKLEKWQIFSFPCMIGRLESGPLFHKIDY
jgi:hypothetical protein